MEDSSYFCKQKTQIMKRVLLNVATVVCFVLTSCGMLTLTSCSKENGVVPDYEKPVVISCVKL